MALRTEDTARKVVKEIGEPPAANPIVEKNLKKDPRFMSVRVKMDVSKPVQAIVNLDIDIREPLKLSYLPPAAMVDIEKENKNSLVAKFRQHFASPGARTCSSQEGGSKVNMTGQVDGGDTASSQYRGSDGGRKDGEATPRREIRVRGRTSRWDRRSEVSPRTQEGFVWRRNVSHPVVPHGSHSMESEKAALSHACSGDLLVGLEFSAQKADYNALEKNLRDKEAADVFTKSFSSGSRSITAAHSSSAGFGGPGPFGPAVSAGMV
ncbi:hypothetical protein OsI_23012 [Oryza sativa Indica Group]|uniref:Uncharacterized protein n=1 Tax=Oryza sativa subsp. indica TaxID=39946 RepID=B8B2E8_ORYSI|nr:hypothetical protein OsI_23012 [Oryza sativa Indica Group]